VISLRHLACLAAGVFSLAPTATSATVILSSGPVSPLPSELGARARWGGTGFEAVMLDAGTQVVGTTLNPVGSPVWQLGQQLQVQKKQNAVAQRANEQLVSELRDLREGLEMVEEQARKEIGMVKPNEIFVQIAK
jgi:hypothetical protein